MIPRPSISTRALAFLTDPRTPTGLLVLGFVAVLVHPTWPRVVGLGIVAGVYGLDRWLTKASPVAVELRDLRDRLARVANKVGL